MAEKIINRIKNVANQWWVMLIFLMSIFAPLGLYYISATKTIYLVLESFKAVIFVFLFLVFVYNIVKNKKLPSKFVFISILFCSFLIISTSLNGQDMHKTINMFATVVSMTYVIELYLQNNKFAKFFDVMFYYVTFLHLVNFCFVIYIKVVGTSANNPMYLLSEDNSLALHNIVFACLVVFKTIKSKKVWPILLLTLPLATTFLVDSATNKLVVWIMILGLALGFVINRKVLFCGALFMLISIVLLVTIRPLSNFVFGLVGKLVNRSYTLTGRTDIWDKALSLFVTKPILGFGDTYVNHINIWGNNYNCHNAYLETMIDGGVVTFIILMLLIIGALVCALVKNKQNKKCYANKAIIIFISMLVIFFMVQACDAIVYAFIIFEFAYYLDDICGQLSTYNKNGSEQNEQFQKN